MFSSAHWLESSEVDRADASGADLNISKRPRVGVPDVFVVAVVSGGVADSDVSIESTKALKAVSVELPRCCIILGIVSGVDRSSWIVSVKACSRAALAEVVADILVTTGVGVGVCGQTV